MTLSKSEFLDPFVTTKTDILDLLNCILMGSRVRFHSDKRKKPVEGVIKSVDYDGEVDEGNWIVFEFEDGTSYPVSLWEDFEVLPEQTEEAN
jgi:hypothetical protein